MHLPIDFAQYTAQLMGDALYNTFVQALEQEAPVSIRLNPLKYLHGVPAAAATQPVPWCEEGRYLSHRPNFTADPLLHAGAYYVQEASSMFVTHVLKQYVHEPVRMLDLCAAPGGKSTAARSVLPEGSLLFANEPMRARANVLCENIQKYGHTDVVVTNNYPRDYARSGILFDVILADVPCSGEGMFRKDEGAVADWSTRKVTECATLQRDIVADAWQCLQPGGLLIYSTCTFNAEEDEKNLLWITEELGGEVLPINTLPDWNITPALWGDLPCCRFIPGFSQGEGLFMAAIRKPGTRIEEKRKSEKEKRKDKKRKGDSTAPCMALPKEMPLLQAESFDWLIDADRLMAVRKPFIPVVREALKTLKVMLAGVMVGTQKGKALIPDQSLALSAMLNTSAYPIVNINLSTALTYLRREAITLPEGSPTGFVLVAYEGLPLGFVKNIGNRSNNLYPNEWRIRSQHIG